MISLTRREALMLATAAPSLGRAEDGQPLKVLLVVAHPDDEYYFAATVYRIAEELNGIVDQVVITNGEGGYRYSALAEKIYGVRLTDEATERSRLPEIRRRETLAAGRILGIRSHYFFGERDLRFTLSAGEALNQGWHIDSIRERLRDLMRRENYGFVFTVLPRESTHGHHQVATVLAIEAANGLEAARRPVVLGAEPGTRKEPAPFKGLDRFPSTQPARPMPEFTFDRQQRFGFENALDYEIVVRWVVAEHKSQGMFQNDVGKHEVENFWRFSNGTAGAAEHTETLARQLRRKLQTDLRKVAQQ